MRILKALGAVTLLAAAAFGQTSFDIADVHLSPRKNWSQIPTHAMDGGVLGGDRYEIRRASMLDLIHTAYGVDPDKIFGGPAWLDYNRYDIIAKTKPATKAAVLKQMLQTLLTDRFHLVLKQETQPIPGFILTAAKGEPKMKRSEAEGPEGCQQGRPTFGNAPPPVANLTCRNISMKAFADWLHLMAKKPIQNATGLDGTWDFDLYYPMGRPDADPPVFAALPSIGLKIKDGNVPQSVLTVVSVDEQPTPNPPGLTEALPPRPPDRFEVASVRPCEDNMTIAPRFQPGGRLTATCMPVLGLLRQAFNLAISQHAIGEPAGLQGRSDHSNITIIAKAPAEALQDREAMNAMLRALMIDRYRIEFHYEDWPMDTATLVAVKPRLTKADPAGRTGCIRQFPDGPGRMGSTPTRLVCHNMTMAQFAEQIPVYDYDVIYPVEEASGLKGAWDFTINFDPMASRGMTAIRMQIFPGAATTNGQAAEPMGGVSLEDAIRKQLGLELKISKRPQPVLVIDHMLEKPTGN